MTLQEVAHKLVQEPKGLLAADARESSMDKKLASVGVPGGEENRRRYREILFTTPEIEKYISGVILADDTLRQSTQDGTRFVDLLTAKDILPGIKVDGGTEPLSDGSKEEVTVGIAGLAPRLAEYKAFGAFFTKWRAVIYIGDGLPTEQAVSENAKRLAAFAKLSQEANLVPIVEPEVLFDGNHTLEQSKNVLKKTFAVLFSELITSGVDLSGLILKTSMALPGKDSGIPLVPEDIAVATVEALNENVPPEVAGIVFLSGGQSPEEATKNLNAIAKRGKQKWPLTFSYARALHNEALEAWRGDDANTEKSQNAFQTRMKMVVLAREGKYTG